MAREVRLGQEAEAGDSPSAWELMPKCLSDNTKVQSSSNLAKEIAQHLEVAK